MIYLFSDNRHDYQVCDITPAGTKFGLWESSEAEAVTSLSKAALRHSEYCSLEDRQEYYTSSSEDLSPLTIVASAPDIPTLISNHPELFI